MLARQHGCWLTRSAAASAASSLAHRARRSGCLACRMLYHSNTTQ